MVAPVFFDTSVLLPALISPGATETPAERLFDALVDGRLERPRTAWHCCLEFFAVATRLPGSARLAPEDAVFLLRQEILPRFDILQLPQAAASDFLQTVEVERIGGGRIYDLHIAEVARASGVRTVVTNNRRHFTSLLRDGIRVLTDAELAGELGV